MTRPEPLVPQDVDCRDLDGFMLNVERLLASELWALSDGDEFKAAVGLWARSWKQVPAASLPNDERILASFAGMPPARFRKVREMAMRGFVECSDGRFYHKVLAAEAVRAWERKNSYRAKREADQQRLKKWRNDRGMSNGEWERVRREVFDRDGWKCAQCGGTDDLHCDHVIAAAQGGASEPANLTTLCRACHSKKTRAVDMPSERRSEMHFTAEDTVRDGTIPLSVPNGTGGKPPDPVKEVIDFGRALLDKAGIKDQQARSIIGKWRSALHHDDGRLMNLLISAQKNHAAAPIPYIEKALKGEIARAKYGSGYVPPGVGG